MVRGRTGDISYTGVVASVFESLESGQTRWHQQISASVIKQLFVCFIGRVIITYCKNVFILNYLSSNELTGVTVFFLSALTRMNLPFNCASSVDSLRLSPAVFIYTEWMFHMD